MSISSLQQEAFLASQSFISQVESLVKKKASYDTFPPEPGVPPPPEVSRVYLDVMRNPAVFQFPETIVGDAAWGVTYDLWAADPKAQEPVLEAVIGKIWYWVLNIPEPVPPAPPEE
jgi:hypothetical protein